MPVIAQPYIACTRMYNINERVSDLWGEIMAEVSRISAVPLRIERHAFPLDVEDLWARPDLGLTFICGRAFMLCGMRHKPVAVPLRRGGNGGAPAPLYSTHILVREEAPLANLEDMLAARIGWTVTHSHSGYLAVKRLLAPLAGDRANGFFSQETGPLHTPMNCLAALRDNRADAVPLDSHYYELLLHNAPETLAGTRILATSQKYPMPFLAASEGVNDGICEALHRALAEISVMPSMAPALEALCITGFGKPDIARYAELVEPGETTLP